jgi:membrane-associated phospholipid phosphatase
VDSYAADPFRTRLRLYLAWSLALNLLFITTYGATNWLTSMRHTRLHLYFDWELAIPFAPSVIWIYLSLMAFFALPLAVLDSAGISRFGRALTLATLIAAAVHLLLPTDLGWPRPAVVPGYPIFDSFFPLDRPHNLVPSLHVTYSALTFHTIWNNTKSLPFKLTAAAWTVLLIGSVSLVHQHHLLDIAAGLILAALVAHRSR